MRKIPVILDIHVEPNERIFDKENPAPWTGYEKIYDFFRKTRRRIQRITGESARFVWIFRLDPQIEESYGYADWPLRRYARFVRELKKNHDEAGLHTHAWRWDESGRTWVADHEDPKWIDHCVRLSFRTYREFFGRDTESFQFGDHWMNNETLSLIHGLGARFDLTLEPGQRPVAAIKAHEKSRGLLPDCMTALFEPYQPSLSNFLLPDPASRQGFWIVPQSAYPAGTDEKGLMYKTLHLAMRGEEFRAGVEHLLQFLKKPYLSIGMRTCAGVKPARMHFIRENLEYLLRHSSARRFIFTTTPDAMRLMGYC
jgi:hypothetical protein